MKNTKKTVKFKINGRAVQGREGESVLSVAERNKIDIPSFCNHPDFCAKGNCRVCVVEINNSTNAKLTTSCSLEIAEGMEIITDSEKVKKARKMNIELIFAEHIEKCYKCIWRFQCKLLKYAEDYNILITKFKDRKSKRKIYKFENAIELDGSQCIDCRNCVDACSKLQKIDFLEIKGKGAAQEIVPSKDKSKKCILCGQCTVHCPVSAAQEQASWEDVESHIKENKKIVVAQFAPSIRVSIGEDFNMKHGEVVTENLVAGLKKLGFDYVFDVSFAADITTIVEAEELLERINNKGKMPMFTSCCPGWVNYVELNHPKLIPHLTTARSPQIHGGGAVKTYWSDIKNIDPKNIIVVSIMPCTAKKYEASRPEMKINGNLPVDYVLTTRELSFMLKKAGIDLSTIGKEKADDPMGNPSGGGVIFGASGGVMESALRVADSYACGDGKGALCGKRIDFKDVRGLDGIKESIVNIAGNKLRVAIVNGIGNIEPILTNISNYDYVEVMACPGGCIGGGGQPIPTTKEIRQKRINALYSLDKSSIIRKSHENESALSIIKWLKKNASLSHKVLHTRFKKR